MQSQARLHMSLVNRSAVHQGNSVLNAVPDAGTCRTLCHLDEAEERVLLHKVQVAPCKQISLSQQQTKAGSFMWGPFLHVICSSFYMTLTSPQLCKGKSIGLCLSTFSMTVTLCSLSTCMGSISQ